MVYMVFSFLLAVINHQFEMILGRELSAWVYSPTDIQQSDGCFVSFFQGLVDYEGDSDEEDEDSELNPSPKRQRLS